MNLPVIAIASFDSSFHNYNLIFVYHKTTRNNPENLRNVQQKRQIEHINT